MSVLVPRLFVVYKRVFPLNPTPIGTLSTSLSSGLYFLSGFVVIDYYNAIASIIFSNIHHQLVLSYTLTDGTTRAQIIESTNTYTSYNGFSPILMKMQWQVDRAFYIESNLGDFSLSFHATEYVYENSNLDSTNGVSKLPAVSYVPDKMIMTIRKIF